MIQHLIILLSHSSIPFCQYGPSVDNKNCLIDIDSLRSGILWGMKENTTFQIVYPPQRIPDEYEVLINTVQNIKIKPVTYPIIDKSDIVVIGGISDLSNNCCYSDVAILRLTKRDLFDNVDLIEKQLDEVSRLNIFITDIGTFTDDDYSSYESALVILKNGIIKRWHTGIYPQLNLLTDRLYLSKMNNCGAGENNITLGPDGFFYICPAFYSCKDLPYFAGINRTLGTPKSGINIKNPHLYTIKYAPICKECDAFQCKRCIWLNRMATYEVNTPGRQQCVISHIERKVSMDLFNEAKLISAIAFETSFKDISYLDPFESLIIG